MADSDRVLRAQAKGIDAIVREVEATTGPITPAEKAEADRRLADARHRAALRRYTSNSGGGKTRDNASSS